MPVRFFAIPALEPGAAEQEFNQFLRGRRVLTIERHLVTAPAPVWCLAVEYLEHAGMGHAGGAGMGDRNA